MPGLDAVRDVPVQRLHMPVCACAKAAHARSRCCKGCACAKAAQTAYQVVNVVGHCPNTKLPPALVLINPAPKPLPPLRPPMLSMRNVL